MIFIFGAAYQGMEEYAQSTYSVKKLNTADENGNIDFSSGFVSGLEKYVLYCVRNGKSAVEDFAAMREEWEDTVLIGLDFSCGLVPMDAETRLWREENGRLNSYLAQQSEHTVRMFCGLPQQMK